MRIYTSVAELIGHTPLVELSRYVEAAALPCRLLAKLEAFNPAGSVKDRAAREMLDAAERAGQIGKGAVIIEPTSGNTGIGLAALCTQRGFRAIFVMPDSMSAERIRLLRAYGAEVVLTPGKEGMAGAIAKATALTAETPGSFMPRQFENMANPAAHYKTTGPEIWADSEGAIDIFVAGVGTGGTISGAGRYLKEQKPSLQVIAVEPADSPVLSGGAAGTHPLQGIGTGFIPAALDPTIYDAVVTISGPEAFAATRRLAKSEGFLAGISSGAALAAAGKIAQQAENQGKTIVVLLPDNGERYLSTALFEDEN